MDHFEVLQLREGDLCCYQYKYLDFVLLLSGGNVLDVDADEVAYHEDDVVDWGQVTAG